MKNKFSTHWKESKQPRKQRKFRANAPLHIKRKLLSANLSKDLRKKFKKRNLPVVKGDIVKIMRGKFKNKTGKVTEVITGISKIKVEGIMVKKQDGSKANIKMQPSNVQIIELNLNDKKRMKTKEDSNKKTESKEVKEEKK
ncbi:MAG: 50S ribosomal protein L24 [Nanoarchaeota archaeon]